MRRPVQGRLRQRLFHAVAALLAIALGLALRKYGYSVHLPFVVVKYGGSLIWGTMLYFVVAIFCAGTPGTRKALLALCLATVVELSRLYHTSALDAFRLTVAGALLLGRVFSLWNIVAYALGIALACALDRSRLANRLRIRD